MIQLAHIWVYNKITKEEEVLYFTSSSHLALNGQNYIPRIGTKLSYTEHLFDTGTTEEMATVGVGNLTLINSDGGLDRLAANYAFDGRKILIYAIPDDAEPVTDDTTLYLSGVQDHPEYGFNEFSIVVKNRMEALNVPLQSATFAGTNSGTGAAGGYEGQSTTIGGKTKPMIFGRCMSVEGAPINDFFLVYAFNYDADGNRKAVYRFYNVYVKGIQYLFCGDYTTVALLVAATIPTGYYATCLAEGLIRLGSVPADNGSVVADVADAPEILCSAGQVASRIFNTAGFVAGTDYNMHGLSVLDLKNACSTGYSISSDEAIGNALNNVLASIGAWFIPDSLGVFQFDIIDSVTALQSGPNAAAYQSTKLITGYNVDPSRTARVQTENQSKNIPAYQVKLNHTKNWKTQDSSALAEAVTNTLRKFFENEFRSVDSTDTDVQTAHLLATALSYDTYLNQPIQAGIQNGDFSIDLTALNAGWTFGNLNGGNGALSQTNGTAKLTPTNGGQCYVQQTLVGTQDITPGSWQLMVTIPGGYTGQVIISQGAVGLWNVSYNATTNDQDLIIPFTMSGAGTQSITITLQTKDATSVAAFASVVVCKPALPTKPVYAGLINGNFNTALPNGWTFSNNAGGTGSQSISGGVITLTPSGTGTCQIVQTLVPPAIWAGNWLFGINVVTGSSASILIQQGATTLYSNTNVLGPQSLFIPIPFTSTGTQSLTITIATINASTVCKVSDAIVCLNHIDVSSIARFLNNNFTIPFAQVNNGWVFNSTTGTGSYTQSNGIVTLRAPTGVSSISQTLTIPDQIQAGSQVLVIRNSAAATGALSVSVYQGTVLLGTMVVIANSTGQLPFLLSSFGATTLTVVISTTSTVTNPAFSAINIYQGKQGIAPTYASLLNGNFSLTIGTGWTFANNAGGSGTGSFSGNEAYLIPVNAPCSITQSILAAGIPAGNWILALTIIQGYAGTVQILSGGVQIFYQAYSSDDDNDIKLNIPFIATGATITVVLGTKGTNSAGFSNSSIYSMDATNAPTLANVINGTFSNNIVNLQAGWIFGNDAGGTGTYSVANGVLTLTPVTAGNQVSQILNVPNSIFAGDWVLYFTLGIGNTASASVYQGTTLLATLTQFNGTAFTQSYSLPFSVNSSSGSTVTVIFHTNSGAQIQNVYASLVTAGLSPQQEADRRLAMEKVIQERYTLDLPLDIAVGIKAGQIITWQIDRFGLDDGKDFLVIGRDDDHDAESSLLDIFRAEPESA